MHKSWRISQYYLLLSYYNAIVWTTGSTVHCLLLNKPADCIAYTSFLHVDHLNNSAAAARRGGAWADEWGEEWFTRLSDRTTMARP